MGMKEIQAEAYRRKRLRLLNAQWRKADLRVAELEDTIRALKRNGTEGTAEEKQRRRQILIALKDKRLKINLQISKLNPMFQVGEEIH
jgi:hypothetical protein